MASSAYDRFLSAEAKRFTTASLAGLVHRFSGVAGVVSLAGGLPPAEAFPLEQLRGLTRRGEEVVVGEEGQAAYLAQQYNFNPQGHPPLLDWLRALTVAQHGVALPPGAPPPSPAAPAPAPAANGGAAAATDPASASPAASPAGPAAAAAVTVSPQPRDVVLSCGAIHAICAAIACLTDPGDTLVVDEYTYTHALECVFLPRDLRLLPVRGDDEGMDPGHLEQQLAAAAAAAAAGGGGGEGNRCRRPRLLYTIPTGHNPTGAVMGEERKRAILRLAHKYDLLILEDDAYYWLYYPRGHVPPQQQPGLGGLPRSMLALEVEAEAREAARAQGAAGGASGAGGHGASSSGGGGDGGAHGGGGWRGGRVVRVDTFSKLLGPGYRLGWLTAPQPLVSKLANWVMASTVGPCSLSQVLVTRLLQQWGTAGFDAYLRDLQALYAGKAAAAHAAAVAHMGDLADFAPARAGMFMWMRLRGVRDVGAVLDDLVAARVVVVPGSMFATRGLAATLVLGDDGGSGAGEDGAASGAGGSAKAAAAASGAHAPAAAAAAAAVAGLPSPCLRLSFAGASPEVLEEGMRRLAAATRAVLARDGGG